MAKTRRLSWWLLPLRPACLALILPATCYELQAPAWVFDPAEVSEVHPSLETKAGVLSAAVWGPRTVLIHGILTKEAAAANVSCAFHTPNDDNHPGFVHDLINTNIWRIPMYFEKGYGRRHPEPQIARIDKTDIPYPMDVELMCTTAGRGVARAGNTVSIFSNTGAWSIERFPIMDLGYLVGSAGLTPPVHDTRPRVTTIMPKRFGFYPLMHEELVDFISWYGSIGVDRVVMTDGISPLALGPNAKPQDLAKFRAVQSSTSRFANGLGSFFSVVKDTCTYECMLRAPLGSFCQEMSTALLLSQLRIDTLSDYPYDWTKKRNAYAIVLDMDELLTPGSAQLRALRPGNFVPRLAAFMDNALPPKALDSPGLKSAPPSTWTPSCYRFGTEYFYSPRCDSDHSRVRNPGPGPQYTPAILRRSWRTSRVLPSDSEEERNKHRGRVEGDKPARQKYMVSVVTGDHPSVDGVAIPARVTIHICCRFKECKVHAPAMEQIVVRHLRADNNERCWQASDMLSYHAKFNKKNYQGVTDWNGLNVVHEEAVRNITIASQLPADWFVLHSDKVPDAYANAFLAMRRHLLNIGM